MSETEIQNFVEFARRKLNNGGVDSLEECLAQWRAEETLASIRRGLNQANAGHTRALHEVDSTIQSKYGFSLDQ